MIEWMQRHKKWLVVTIWISTISFIAAGMVGWGSYNFSLNQDSIAKVGGISISQREFQDYYRQIYAQANPDGKLDAKKAQELGLERVALKGLIERALLKNLALDLGLRVSEEEVATEIAKQSYFQREGRFDPQIYRELLAQNNLRPSDFEQEVSSDLLIQKIAQVLPSKAYTPLEEESFLFPFLIQDTVKLKILTPSPTKPVITESDLMKFWEDHKKRYQNPARYKIRSILVRFDAQKPSDVELQKLYEEAKGQHLDAQGRPKSFKDLRHQLIQEQRIVMAEDAALRAYVELKKDQAGQKGQEQNLQEGDMPFGEEVARQLQEGRDGEVFKPVRVDEGFLVFKILQKSPPTAKSFQEAKEEVRADLSLRFAQEKMQELAQRDVREGFESKKIVQVAMGASLPNLSLEESTRLVERILTSQKKRDWVSLGSKIVVFEVLDQKLFSQRDARARADSKRALGFYKEEILSKELYRYLEKKYKIVYFQRRGE